MRYYYERQRRWCVSEHQDHSSYLVGRLLKSFQNSYWVIAGIAYYDVFCFSFLFVCILRQGSPYVAQTSLEITILCLSLPSDGITGMDHHTRCKLHFKWPDSCIAILQPGMVCRSAEIIFCSRLGANLQDAYR